MNLVKVLNVTSKVAHVILAISVIGDLAGKYFGSRGNDVASEVGAEDVTAENK